MPLSKEEEADLLRRRERKESYVSLKDVFPNMTVAAPKKAHSRLLEDAVNRQHEAGKIFTMKQEELRYTGTQAYGQQDAGSSNNGTPYTGGDASATFLAGQMSVMEEGSYMDPSAPNDIQIYKKATELSEELVAVKAELMATKEQVETLKAAHTAHVQQHASDVKALQTQLDARDEQVVRFFEAWKQMGEPLETETKAQ